jgi:hypothetical protein
MVVRPATVQARVDAIGRDIYGPGAPAGVAHARAHAGGLSLVLPGGAGRPGHVLTGDTLFPGGPGRTTSPEDFTSLMHDLEERVFGPLPDETWVYPGHGDDTTLGAERPHLAEWRARGWCPCAGWSGPQTSSSPRAPSGPTLCRPIKEDVRCRRPRR